MPDSPTCFKLTIENNIAHIVLNRPEAMNSMPRAFWNELPALVNDINDNAKARVIVISSTGKHFTAGMDISVFTDGEGVSASGGDPYARAEAFRRSFIGQLNDALLYSAGQSAASVRAGRELWERIGVFEPRERTLGEVLQPLGAPLMVLLLWLLATLGAAVVAVRGLKATIA